MDTTQIEFYRRRLMLLRRAVEQDFQINRSPSVCHPRHIIPNGHLSSVSPTDRNPRLELTELHLEIDRALARISRGSFGQCSVCRAPIEDARLPLIPYTSKCHACAFEEVTTIETSVVFENLEI